MGDNIEFTYARKSDFNVMRDKKYPFITLDPLTASSTFAVDNVFNYSKTWLATMTFYDLDNEASIPDEYRKILDEMDVLVDKFITKLNLTAEDHLGITITNMSQQPFIKVLADSITGFILSFNITVPDNWDYCVEC